MKKEHLAKTVILKFRWMAPNKTIFSFLFAKCLKKQVFIMLVLDASNCYFFMH